VYYKNRKCYCNCYAASPTTFCQGDSVNLSVTNTTGYSYQWKKDGGVVGINSYKFTAKSTGLYTVVVSNTSSCSSASSNSVNVVVTSLPAASAINPSGSTTFCSGGSIDLSIPFNSGLTYQWRSESGIISGANSNLFTVTTSGNYLLEITNSSGCTIKTLPLNVVVKPMPNKPVINSDRYQKGICLGETPIKLNVNQAFTGYSYQWYKNGLAIPNATLSYYEGFISAGDYTLEANINGCKSTSINYPVEFAEALPKPVIYAVGPSLWFLACSNDSASQYKWYYNGNPISGANKFIYVANRNLGRYNVSIANTKGCFTLSDTIKIPTGSTGIDDVDPFASLKIYPNPSSGLVNVELDNMLFGELIIRIFTPEGREIINIRTEKTNVRFSHQINLSENPNGLYFISIYIKGKISNNRLIID
jgi:hypothetical protein